jgi:hypothetical protein
MANVLPPLPPLMWAPVMLETCQVMAPGAK